MTRRARAMWAGAVAVAVAFAVGSPAAGRWAVERDIRRNNSAHLTPAERGELAERLRAAAGRPGLSPGERSRGLRTTPSIRTRATRRAKRHGLRLRQDFQMT